MSQCRSRPAKRGPRTCGFAQRQLIPIGIIKFRFEIVGRVANPPVQ
jgi:hypothetical protein